MSFPDPVQFTYDTDTITCPKIQDDGLMSLYRLQSGNVQYDVTISHQISKGRVRRMFRIDHTLIAPDPLTSANQKQTYGAYLVVDEPDSGIIDDENIVFLVNALTGFLTASSSAKLVKLLNTEH